MLFDEHLIDELMLLIEFTRQQILIQLWLASDDSVQ